MAKTVSASFLFSGNGQFFQGHGEQENEMLLYTSIGPHTTIREAIDGWLEDFNGRGDYPETFDGIEEDEVRTGLIEMLSPDGRKEYEDKNAGPSQDLTRYIEIEMKECPECNGDADGCDTCDGTGEVEDEDADYDLQAIVLITVEGDEEDSDA